MFLVLVLTIVGAILSPKSLEWAYRNYYVEKYPCVIMGIGDYQYVMDEPGGKVRKVEKVREYS